jgi:hypothetical protein
VIVLRLNGCRFWALALQAPFAHSIFWASPENRWGLSSAGRAPDLHSGGQEFDPPRLHQDFLYEDDHTSKNCTQFLLV